MQTSAGFRKGEHVARGGVFPRVRMQLTTRTPLSGFEFSTQITAALHISHLLERVQNDGFQICRGHPSPRHVQSRQLQGNARNTRQITASVQSSHPSLHVHTEPDPNLRLHQLR